MPGALEFSHRLGAARRRGRRRDPQRGELTRQHSTVHLDVIDDQDAELCERLGKHPTADRWAGGAHQRDLEPKPAPLTKLALDANFAAHELESKLRSEEHTSELQSPC